MICEHCNARYRLLSESIFSPRTCSFCDADLCGACAALPECPECDAPRDDKISKCLTRSPRSDMKKREGGN